MPIYIIRYAEIFLKGKNRSMFEKKLVSNIKDCLKKNKVKYNSIKLAHNRILVCSKEDCSCIKYVFGISSFSKATETEQDIEAMKKTSFKLYKKGSFRISSQRLEKSFKYNSEEINRIVGAYVVKNTRAPVNLEKPDTNIGIELFGNKAYLFNSKTKGLGGLPVGIEGNVALLLEDYNSLLAGILMLKRGCSLIVIKKHNIGLKLLRKFCYGFNLKIAKSIPKNAKAVIVNDTLDSIKKRNFKIAIFRPLIGYNTEYLKKWLTSI